MALKVESHCEGCGSDYLEGESTHPCLHFRWVLDGMGDEQARKARRDAPGDWPCWYPCGSLQVEKAEEL